MASMLLGRAARGCRAGGLLLNARRAALARGGNRGGSMASSASANGGESGPPAAEEPPLPSLESLAAQKRKVADWTSFEGEGARVAQWVKEYYDRIESYPVRSTVQPGYLRELMPDRPPEEGEPLEAVLEDVERLIMPGVTHWQHPGFHAFYPAITTKPALLGDMVSGMFNCIGFTWEASPAITELETIMMDWLARVAGLPDVFLSDSVEAGQGGGVIQGTASEACAVAMIAARDRALRRVAPLDGGSSGAARFDAMSRMTVYVGSQAHTCVKKAAMISGLYVDPENVRTVPTTGATNYEMDPAVLEDMIRSDIADGKIPVYVCLTMGTTNTCAIDPIREVGAMLRDPNRLGGEQHNIWLHVDAAYAGSALICPEYHDLLQVDGLQHADSFNFNAHKWLGITFDMSCLWVQDQRELVDALSITPEILRSKAYDEGAVMDFRDMQLPLGRRFRALKLWFAFRYFGLKTIQDHIRYDCALANEFADLVRADDRFEIVAPPRLGLVCFRLKASNDANKTMKERVNDSGRAFLVSTTQDDKFTLRFSVSSSRTTREHMEQTWSELQRRATDVLAEMASSS